MSGVAGRLDEVRARIAQACARTGRPAGSVTLVAVSKTRSVLEMQEALAAGHTDFGENRVQEAEAKLAQGLLGPPGEGRPRLHLIGHLQSNKARAAAAVFAAIHSIDSADLLRRLEAAAPGRIDGLVQLKLAHEATKSGARPEELGALLEQAAGLARVRVVGLMCIPPAAPDAEAARPYFRRLREIRDAHGGERLLPHLSMGMSGDFEVAIEEGATLVRVGEAIFGPRAPVAGEGAAHR